jgi:hypothetical protein
MTLQKITEFYTEWFGVYANISSELRTTAIFKSFVKKNNDSYKTRMYVHDLSRHQTSFVHVQRFMNCLHRTKCEFLTLSRLPCSYFWLFAKVGLLKAVIHLNIYRHKNVMVPR